MLFSEAEFWVFFSIVVVLYFVLRHRAQNVMLLIASMIFYGAWDWRFLGLIFSSIILDFIIALRMNNEFREDSRNFLLFVSLAYNLGVLCVFKYLGFFVESFTSFLAEIGLTASPVILKIVLPVGISFYTFQTLSYTIDVYRRELKPAKSFIDYAVFVMFFPQLVAGPIERARHLLPMVTRPREPTWEQFTRGSILCLLGLVKKIVVADGVAPSVDAIYSAPAPSGADIMIATWLFAIQIYCDFSGYTDIARGLAKIMGFELMLNFYQPYFSRNPQMFWRRWHISLSTWLRDYLYIPLGGNRGGAFVLYRNLMMTMVLGGLWHGAAWNFVLWGGYQGALLAIHRMITPRSEGAVAGGGGLFRILATAAFFQVICYGWLLFRASSFEQIVDFTSRLATLSLGDFAALAVPAPPLAAILGIGGLLVWDAVVEVTGSARFYERMPLVARGGLYAGLIYILAFGATTSSSAFIYFQF